MGRPRGYERTEVLRRARDTFHDHGYAATSIEQLSQATRLNRSSLYGAFGDKHGLFMDAFTQYRDEELVRLREELAGDPAHALTRLRDHFRAKTADPAASRRGCLLAKSTAELAAQDAEVAGMARAFYAAYERALADCVAQAQATGDLRSDLAPDRAGAMLLAVLRGIEALGRAGQSRRALQEIADTALAALAAS
jgi:TetR/AcrR family transcriptional regulator, transcriptional repressor for nem operon